MAHEAYRQVITALREQLKALDVQRGKILNAIAAIEDLPAPPETPTLPALQASGSGSVRSSDDSPSYPEAGEVVLREAGRQLHVNQIIRRAQLRGWYADKKPDDRGFRNAVAGSLDRRVRDGDTFEKPEPATYALIEWSTNGSNESAPNSGAAESGAEHATSTEGR